MNVLKYGYCGIRGIKGITHNVGQFFRNIRYAYQRITKGFCDFDCWNLDTFYTNLFIASLTDFNKHTHGYPGVGIFDDEQAKLDGYEGGADRWGKYIAEMVTHFKNTLEDNPDSEYNKRIDYLYNEYQRTHSNTDAELWINEEKDFYKYREKEKNKALDMFKEHFFSLWD